MWLSQGQETQCFHTLCRYDSERREPENYYISKPRRVSQGSGVWEIVWLRCTTPPPPPTSYNDTRLEWWNLHYREHCVCTLDFSPSNKSSSSHTNKLPPFISYLQRICLSSSGACLAEGRSCHGPGGNPSPSHQT